MYSSYYAIGQTNPLIDSLKTELSKAKVDSIKIDLLCQIGWETVPLSPEEALKYAQQVEPIALKLKDPYRLNKVYRLYAFCYGDLNDRPKCLENHLKRIQILEATGEHTRDLASAYYEAASVMDGQGQTESALVYYEKCREIGIELNNKILYAYPLLPITSIQVARGDTALAKSNIRLALKLVEGEETPVECVLLTNLADILTNQDSLEEAKILLEKAYAFEGRVEPDAIGFVYSGSARIYVKTNQPKKAIREYYKALATWEPINKYFYLPGLYIQMARLYETINPDSSVYFFEKYIKLSEQVNTEDNNSKIAEMEALFQNQQKQKEIELLSAANQISDLENKKQEQISMFVSIGLIAVIIFSIFLISRIRIIRNQNKLIEAQRVEVTKQKEIVEEKSREIFDSINYAKRIQKAAMPESSVIKDIIPQVVVTYLPKDNLSGDFYWFGKIKQDQKEKVLIALGDCTGHGVPGALLSILGINYLNISQNAEKTKNPAEVLNFLNEGIHTTFQSSENEIRDGMDIAIMTVDYEQNKLFYATAKNAIYLIRNGELQILKGNNHAIGKSNRTDIIEPFNMFDFTFQKGDLVYLFSDGYADQFGGEKGKKFSSKNLRKLLSNIAHLPLKEQQQKLDENFHIWKSNFEQLDDVCYIGILL